MNGRKLAEQHRQAWIKRIHKAACRVYINVGLQSEAVMQRCLAFELQTFAASSVTQEVQHPIYYTNSHNQTLTVGTVRFDICFLTQIATFVLELKVASHNRRTTAAQLQKYSTLFDKAATATTIRPVLLLIEFGASAVDLFVYDVNQNDMVRKTL